MICFFEFHKAHSKILLTASADQLQYNLSLIKLHLACVKQNAAVAKNVQWKRCLFIVSKIVIIWPSRTMPEFISYQICTGYKTFLTLKHLFHLFLSSSWLHFLEMYVIIMSLTRFRVNLLLETGALSEV